MSILSRALTLPALGLLLLPTAARAQAQRDLGEIGYYLYQQANSPAALERMRRDLVNAPEAYLVALDQPGTLILPDKRRVRVPALKYNVALHLLEARDSTGSHVWPPGSLDGFVLSQGTEARHFRTYKVRTGSTKLDFVEVLTVDDDSPLVLAVQHIYVHEDAQIDPVLRTISRAGRTEIGQVVVAGSGTTPKEPLRELVLNRREVSRLFVPYAAKVDAYATEQRLSYTDLSQVLRMVEYYNQKVVGK